MNIGAQNMASVQTSSIKSEERSLGTILSDKRPLRVPAYQRSYTWKKDQIDDLWQDLQAILYGGQDSHFLGSMVFIQKSDNSLEVVDGQQRIATVSILLSVIRDGFTKINDLHRASHVETSYLCSRNLKSLEAFPRLSLNETDNDLYCQIIDKTKDCDALVQISKNKELPESNRLLASSYLLLHELLKKSSDDFSNIDYLSSVVEAITDNISCIQIITTNEESAYVLFETLNDRGMELTLSDMLKNFLFSKAGKRIEEAKNKWTQIVTYIGQQYMKTFIRHEWMSKYGQTREKDLFKRIKSEVRSNPKAIDYITNLCEAANVYDAIKNPDHEIWSGYGIQCQTLLDEISLLGSIQCYPLILSTYLSKPSDLPTILKWIINLTVRYSIICGKGTGNLETAYAKASSNMRRPEIKLREVKESLLNIWPNDNEFKSSFKERTLSSPRIIKYLLSKIEIKKSNNDSQIPNPDNLTVEHILPKKPGIDWHSRMRTSEFINSQVSKIGNMTILTAPMNRECESRGFLFKKVIYQESTYQITKDLCLATDWTETEIAKRQEELADIAATVWVIE